MTRQLPSRTSIVKDLEQSLAQADDILKQTSTPGKYLSFCLGISQDTKRDLLDALRGDRGAFDRIVSQSTITKLTGKKQDQVTDQDVIRLLKMVMLSEVLWHPDDSNHSMLSLIALHAGKEADVLTDQDVESFFDHRDAYIKQTAKDKQKDFHRRHKEYADMLTDTIGKLKADNTGGLVKVTKTLAYNSIISIDHRKKFAEAISSDRKLKHQVESLGIADIGTHLTLDMLRARLALNKLLNGKNDPKTIEVSKAEYYEAFGLEKKDGHFPRKGRDRAIKALRDLQDTNYLVERSDNKVGIDRLVYSIYTDGYGRIEIMVSDLFFATSYLLMPNDLFKKIETIFQAKNKRVSGTLYNLVHYIYIQYHSKKQPNAQPITRRLESLAINIGMKHVARRQWGTIEKRLKEYLDILTEVGLLVSYKIKERSDGKVVYMRMNHTDESLFHRKGAALTDG